MSGIPSLFLPMLWYTAAWKQGGDEFLNVVLAENFARFLHLTLLKFPMIWGMRMVFGTISWRWRQALYLGLFSFSSLYSGLKLSKPEQPIKEILKNTWKRIRSMEKVRLFSLVALVGILFFYSIPSSKRSVYLMPAYPFIALFLLSMPYILQNTVRK